MKFSIPSFKTISSGAFLLGAATLPASAYAQTFTEAVTGGTANGDFRLRYESVDQDNARDDATALTLRSRIGYTTDSFEGFSAKIEAEDVRIVAGQDEYSLPGGLFNGTEYSVIADPEVTEIDQAFVQYKAEGFTGRLGRQVIAYDTHRFVGHVGWRQDRQTFDGLKLDYSGVENLSVSYSYIEQRNRILGEERDILSNDHLLNLSYKLGTGKVTAYAYLLDNEDADAQLDTYGISYTGKVSLNEVGVAYTAEYATQESETAAGADNDADYLFAEVKAEINGITFGIGYEVLGSDDSAYGFATPLATLHKFNGWSDQFLNTPAQGLEDLYLSVSTKVAGGKLALIYHDFSADDAAAGQADDLGDELNLLYAKKFGKHYYTGVKYAMYSQGDDNSPVDTDKLWIWGGITF